MAQVDPIARAIDWLDACKANDLETVCSLYAPDATSSIPSVPVSGPGILLSGAEQHRRYWVDAFQSGTTEVFELVEIYPGRDSAVLIYYDRYYRRVCEYLQFNDAGLISTAARHLVARRRRVFAMPASTAAEDDAISSIPKLLRCEARQNLEEARQLPVGLARNSLRQRAIALGELSKRETYGA
jgi:hypothetical protein